MSKPSQGSWHYASVHLGRNWLMPLANIPQKGMPDKSCNSTEEKNTQCTVNVKYNRHHMDEGTCEI